MPVHLRESPSGRGLLQQVHIALSLLKEDSSRGAPSQRLVRLSGLYGTALSTLLKIFESDFCYKCDKGEGCSFCRARMFRDFAVIDIQGKLLGDQ